MQHISPKSSKSSSSAAASKKSKGKAAAAPPDDKDCGKKVLPVVLAGINRALPFASASGGGSRSTAAVEALMESLFETVEVSLGSFSASTQALLVLQQLLLPLVRRRPNRIQPMPIPPRMPPPSPDTSGCESHIAAAHRPALSSSCDDVRPQSAISAISAISVVHSHAPPLAHIGLNLLRWWDAPRPTSTCDLPAGSRARHHNSLCPP